MNYVQLVISGLSVGSIYALLALSYALVYRSTRAINFAQGDLGGVGAYVAYAIAGGASVGLLGALGGILATVVLAVLIERIAFRPLYKIGAIYVIVSSIALTFVLQGGMQRLWGSRGVSVEPLIAGSIHIGEVQVQAQSLIIFSVLAAVAVLLSSFFRTRIGIAMRASAEAPEVAALQGVNHGGMSSLTYAMGGVLTGIAGVLVAPTTLLTPGSGGHLGLIALIAAIIGGLGSVRGAFLAGLAIGIIQMFAAYFLGGGYVTMLLFGILVIVLVVRPLGIFGEEGARVRQ